MQMMNTNYKRGYETKRFSSSNSVMNFLGGLGYE